MKQAGVISIGLILLGFVFEYLYFLSNSMFFDVKFAILGTVCILAGMLGLLAYVILPYLDEKNK